MGKLYESLVRPVLFSQDPERMHEWAMFGMRTLATLRPLARIMERCNAVHGQEPVRLWDLEFPNFVGLAAGFDKNAEAWRAASALGFGHIEVGTITGQGQPGNPRPRVFRIPQQEALINRMGFNNQGAEAIAQSLQRDAANKRPRRIPLGINIGKTKVTPLEEAADDYIRSFNHLADYADYFTINVSSPNTPELRKLQEEQFLPQLLGGLRKVNSDRAKKMGGKPIPMLIKIAPDLSYREIDTVLSAVQEHQFDGIVATNTTLARPPEVLACEHGQESGGLSGRPVHKRSVDIVNYIYRASEGKLPIIGCGGIFDERTAGEFMDAGAKLVQIYSGLIYKGPFFPAQIAAALAWRQRAWL